MSRFFVCRHVSESEGPRRPLWTSCFATDFEEFLPWRKKKLKKYLLSVLGLEQRETENCIQFSSEEVEGTFTRGKKKELQKDTCRLRDANAELEAQLERFKEYNSELCEENARLKSQMQQTSGENEDLASQVESHAHSIKDIASRIWRRFVAHQSVINRLQNPK